MCVLMVIDNSDLKLILCEMLVSLNLISSLTSKKSLLKAAAASNLPLSHEVLVLRFRVKCDSFGEIAIARFCSHRRRRILQLDKNLLYSNCIHDVTFAISTRLELTSNFLN